MASKTPGLIERLAFLTTASTLLAPSCPSIAAHLQTTHSDTAFENNLTRRNEQDKHQFCQKCGYRTGLHTQTKQSPRTRRRTPRQRRPGGKTYIKNASPSTRLVTACSNCHHVSTSDMSKSKRTGARKLAHATRGDAEVAVSAMTNIHNTLTEATAQKKSRKQKQSQRKKEQSLHAMLAKAKEGTQTRKSGFGLDLMDFMKSGT